MSMTRNWKQELGRLVATYVAVASLTFWLALVVGGLSAEKSLSLGLSAGAAALIVRGIMIRSVFMYPFAVVFAVYAGAQMQLGQYVQVHHPEYVGLAPLASMTFSMVIAVVVHGITIVFDHRDFRRTIERRSYEDK